MIWKVTLSNDQVITEDTIFDLLVNNSKLTPWLLLEEYCERHKLEIKEINLWDSSSAIRLYTPGKLATLPPDSINFRRKYVCEGMSSDSSPTEIAGIVITKNSTSVGVWCNSKTKEIFTTIE